MGKLRVYQLARELNLDNSEVIRELQHLGVPVTSHSNTVEDRLADQLRKKLGPAAAAAEAAKTAATPSGPGDDAEVPAPVHTAPEPAAVPSAEGAVPQPPVVETKPVTPSVAALEADVKEAKELHEAREEREAKDAKEAKVEVKSITAPAVAAPPPASTPIVQPAASVSTSSSSAGAATPPPSATPTAPPAVPPAAGTTPSSVPVGLQAPDKAVPQKPAAPTPPPAPPAGPRREIRGVQFVEPRQPVSPIVSLPPEKKPAPPAPPKPEVPHEERRTMQQIVQERLRQQNRLPQPPPRRPDTRPPGPPPRGGQPGLQNRGAVPAGPPGSRPVTRPLTSAVPPAAPADQRRQIEIARTQQRYERHQEKKLGTPFVKPQPKIEAPREFRKITLTEGVTVKDLAEKLDVKPKDMIKKLMERGVFAGINQSLDNTMAKDIARDFNAEAEFVTFEESVILDHVEVSAPENLVPRAPVVTIMGHVDHGKTSLLDAIRKSRVTESEHGGITQHIGAYQVKVKDRKITFLDTPGHEAFTLMRARGARVTDVVVLVVAADDGVMPQTIESISHTRAAKVPFVVAINKVDKAGVNVERVKRELADQGLQAEDWGGDTVMVEVSARTGKNLDELLEMILLVADIQTLKADPSLPATGTVLEAKIDKGRGNVATVLVQNGTLKVGDNFVAGAVYGKVRAMFDERSSGIKEAGPSTPVEVLGLQGLPLAGDTFQCVDDNKARQVSQFRQDKLRETALAKNSRLTLDQLHRQLAESEVKEVPIVLKCDVQGSQEALSDMLNKLSTDKVKVRILHSSVGAINETDVVLAVASNAIIIGFNVRPERKAQELANREKVDIRLHTIIYNVVDEIKQAMVGVLEPVIKETRLGAAEVRNTFRVPKVGMIAGCYITDGKVTRNAEVRLLRDNVVIYEGKISSLKRFKDDASEVTRGYECGIGIQNFNDLKVGDTIEAFITEKVMPDA